jgi:hypothetical protein
LAAVVDPDAEPDVLVEVPLDDESDDSTFDSRRLARVVSALESVI